jgi:O-antigen ligase
MGMMLLVAAAVMQPNLKSNWINFIREKSSLFLLLYVLSLWISIFWTTDFTYFIQRSVIYLPLAVLPFSFFSFRNELKPEQRKLLWLFFLLLVFLGNMFSTTNYLLHKENYDLAYGFSKVIPTPFKNDHIRYSMAVICAIPIGLFLHNQLTSKWMRVMNVVNIVFNIVFLHILSAKTGLVGLYLIGFLFLAHVLYQSKTRKWGIILLAGMALTPILAYQVSSSFRIRLSYLRYSFHEMRNSSQQAQVSDEGRLISYQYALEELRKNPWFGVGLGDVYRVMDDKFHRDFPTRTEEPLLPHNQFLMAWLAAGILPLLFLMGAQGYFGWKSFRSGVIYFALFTVMFIGMTVDSLFETQYGTCIFCFIILGFFNHFHKPFKMNYS